MKLKQRLMVLWIALFVAFGASILSACENFLGTPTAPVILYELSEDGQGVEVVGYQGAIQTAEIEETYQGFHVFRIRENAFKNCRSLKTIVLPESIREIGENAFANCDNLTNIRFPISLDVLGNNAFYDCDNLTNVTFNHNIRQIGSDAFTSCDRLTTNRYENGEYLPSESTPYFALLSTINKGMFGIRLHEDMHFILSGAFDGCTALTMLDMPAIVQHVAPNALTDCAKLKTVYFHGTLTQWAVLENGTPFTTAKVYYYSEKQPTKEGDFWHYENGVPTVWEAVACKHNWKTTTVPPTCTEQGYDETKCTKCGESKKSNFTSPKHSNIVDGVCTNCDTFVGSAGVVYENKGSYAVVTDYTGTDTKVYIHDTFEGVPVTSIGDSAFSSCTSLTNITIPNSVTSIGDGAFAGCSNLMNITIPDSVTSIGERAFYNCTSLTSITIPNSVTSIGEGAFSGCTSLTSVYYKGTESDWANISIGSSNSYLKKATRYYYSEEEPTETGNWWYYDENGIPTVWETVAYSLNSDKASYTVTSIVECTDTVLNIPSTYQGLPVTSIGDGAFRNCTSLTSITIPDSVTSIGEYAFYNCTNLTSMVIGDSVASIGDRAFDYCSSLTSIIIPDSVTSIGYGTFYNCNSLTSIIIPDGVTSIGERAFAYCTSLTSITIPNSVTSIGYGTFYNCNRLTTVYYKGTESDWANISIDSSDSSLNNATRYYYSKKQPTKEGDFWHYENGVPTVWETVAYSVGLTYSLNSNNASYTVIALGECTDTDLIIPPTYKGLPVTSIGDDAFAYCYNLASVVIPDSVTSIGSSAFWNCNSLTEIVIPDSVTFIGHRVFSYCSSLTSVIVPDSVTFIGEYAFYGCSNLTIYCEVKSQPSGWNLYWNYPIRPVVWGYTGE